jgi:hypothetical protein
MTPKTETETRYPGRSDARVAPARAPHVPAAPAWDPRGASVSWSHVLPLGVLLAFANGFWIIVLRGAVGAIERTSAPFSAWLHESSLLIPVYVVAVLAAFLVAQRWFGPRPRRLPAVGAIIATVALAATAAGTLLLTASSWFDYRLQRADLEHMRLVHPGCDLSCTTARVHATVGLEFKAVWIGLLLMLATNLVLITLMVAIRGGVVVLSRPPRVAKGRRVEDARLVLAAGLVGAAAIHAAVVPAHLDRSSALGVLLLVLALAGVACAAAVLAPARTPALGLLAAAVVSAVPLLVWVVARTTGLPFVHETASTQAISVWGVMAGILDLITLAIAVTLLRRRRPAVAWNRQALTIAVTAVLAGTVIGIGGASLPVVGAFASLDNPPELHQLIPQG